MHLVVAFVYLLCLVLLTAPCVETRQIVRRGKQEKWQALKNRRAEQRAQKAKEEELEQQRAAEAKAKQQAGAKLLRRRRPVVEADVGPGNDDAAVAVDPVPEQPPQRPSVEEKQTKVIVVHPVPEQPPHEQNEKTEAQVALVHPVGTVKEGKTVATVDPVPGDLRVDQEQKEAQVFAGSDNDPSESSDGLVLASMVGACIASVAVFGVAMHRRRNRPRQSKALDATAGDAKVEKGASDARGPGKATLTMYQSLVDPASATFVSICENGRTNVEERASAASSAFSACVVNVDDDPPHRGSAILPYDLDSVETVTL